MSRSLAILIPFFMVWANLAYAQTDSHSVESIRAALQSPISPEILQQAQQFDNQVISSRMVGNQPVAFVKSDRAAQIVGNLLRAIRADPSKWAIRILDTNPKTVNAFVVGGNYIYVYTGLLDFVENDDELALILGHEISHSWLKHNLRRGEDFTNLLASFIELGGALSRNPGRKDTLGLVGGAIKSAYSRQDEQEADALGAYIAKRASYDPARGIAYFARMINRENSINAQNQAQISAAKQSVEQQNANCQNLQNQWNTQPRIRTQQNAQVVNSTCQAAQANTQKYNAFVKQHSGGQLRSALLSTHPADRDRIAALAASVDYLRGNRTLESLSGIGQGYMVYVAMNMK
ncbi:MAG: M48 family metallopeptidase [Pseudomonadota bacterium]